MTFKGSNWTAGSLKVCSRHSKFLARETNFLRMTKIRCQALNSLGVKKYLGGYFELLCHLRTLTVGRKEGRDEKG